MKMLEADKTQPEPRDEPEEQDKPIRLDQPPKKEELPHPPPLAEVVAERHRDDRDVELEQGSSETED
jgi:hypothetical protein